MSVAGEIEEWIEAFDRFDTFGGDHGPEFRIDGLCSSKRTSGLNVRPVIEAATIC
jgi:hypothetical protein